MALKIYPPIGFGRVGNSSNFIIAREQDGLREMEIDQTGNETDVTQYKDDEGIKPVAARFRIFDVPDDGSPPKLFELPDNATIEWTVHIVNRKNAVQRPSDPPGNTRLPVPIGNPKPMTIDPKERKISGANASGKVFDGGEFMNEPVTLGELRTDGAQNLLVIGGRGFSSSPSNDRLRHYYRNPKWHDDTSDGPVTARVLDSIGDVLAEAAPAWVVVGPPDFAPDIEGLVTLYDIARDTGRGSTSLGDVSFTHDVFPMLHRTHMMQWVNSEPEWTDMRTDWDKLADKSPAAKADREEVAEFVRAAASVLRRHFLTPTQKIILKRYEEGTFDSDWTGMPQPDLTPEQLTRVALDSTVGQGFFPGIEAGIVMRNHRIWTTPFEFRLDHNVVKAGDLTALMAVPWQADFIACSDDWWPSQRPNVVRLKPTAPDTDDWQRPYSDGDFKKMVDNFALMGFVVKADDGGGNVVYAEDQRAPDSEF